MEYRELGMSGLKVSAFGLGAMTFGGQTPEDEALRQLDIAHEAGINLFDTAENYPTPTGRATQGRSEAVLVGWINERGLRDRVMVATKVAGPGNAAGDMSHIRGDARRLDRTNIRTAIEASLSRLATDYIDLFQIHWPDRIVTSHGRSRYSLLRDPPELVSLEDTLGVLRELVAEGKIRAIGVCNESPWGEMRYLAEADRRALPRLSCIQNGYSLIDRYFEQWLAEVAIREGIGLLAYSPLGRGTLTGKYRNPSTAAAQSANFVARSSRPRANAPLRPTGRLPWRMA